jgi:microcystin-dependent protein
MAQPYVGEIRMFAGNFAPADWMFCGGQLLPISEYESLFSLIGTTYGGDGQSTFGLPDLRGRLPLHQGNGFVIGEAGGAEAITLTVPQIPQHTHAFLASTSIGTTPNPEGRALASSGAVQLFRESAANQAMSHPAVAPAGGSQPHMNFQPYLSVSFIICLYGLYPNQP